MTMLANLTITTAVTAQTTGPVQFMAGIPQTLGIQANFGYGSGGTTADAWVQTSYDDGGTWADVANFHFTTSSARNFVNLSSLSTVTTPAAATDGTLASNTTSTAPLGPLWRVKYTTTGTYAGGTTLKVHVVSAGRMTLR